MDRNESVDQLAEQIETGDGLDKSKDLRSFLNGIPQLRRFIVAAAIRALTARRYYYSKEQKGMVFEPDSSTQMKAVAWLAAYSDGMPMQSTVNLNVEAGAKGLTMADALESSPAMRDFVREQLAKAEGKKALPA